MKDPKSHSAFGFEPVEVPIGKLRPSRKVPDRIGRTVRFQTIKSSVKEIGLVEPVMVFPIKETSDEYLIVDGHLRVEVMRQLGRTQISCLISNDDEGFTYNSRINRLSSVQEHFMIVRAIDNGVPEDKIAAALGVSVSTIRSRTKLLNGISPRVIQALKTRQISANTTRILRRLKPERQLEVVELMEAANNYTAPYANALYVATPHEQLVTQKKRKIAGVSEEQIERMETELDRIRRDIKHVEEDYGTNMLRLVVANGYISRLLDNDHVRGFLQRHHTVLLEQLIVIQDSIDADIGANA